MLFSATVERSPGIVTRLDEETLVSAVGSTTVIDRYTDAFVAGLDSSNVTVQPFDSLVLAEDETNAELVWGAVHDHSKHMALLSGENPDEASVAEVKDHVARLNQTGSKQAAAAFVEYLQDHYDSVTTLSAHALVEVPDPVAAKIGEYPVANLIVYALPDGEIIRTVEVTLKSTGFSAENREEVLDRVSEGTPAGDVERYAEEVYDETIRSIEDDLTANLVRDVTADDLSAAGYDELGTETVSKELNPLHSGESATLWQKEIWTVEGIEASTGFARVWLLDEHELGIVQPTEGDFDADDAIGAIRTELSDELPE